MKIEVFDDADAVAREAAKFIAAEARGPKEQSESLQELERRRS